MKNAHVKALVCGFLLTAVLAAGVSADLITTDDICTDEYELGASENYTSVAEDLNTTPEILQALNPSHPADQLYTELVITVPATPANVCCTAEPSCVYVSKAGDTLTSIATNVFASKGVCLAAANPSLASSTSTSATLPAGTYLNAPCKDGDSTPCPYALCGWRIGRFDTLAKIAATTKTTVECLKKQNPGRTFTTGAWIATPCIPKPTPPSYDSCSATAFPCLYVPKPFDTYDSIARFLCTNAQCLREQNGGAQLKVGWTMPAPCVCVDKGFTERCAQQAAKCFHTYIVGDNVVSIARRYNTTLTCLRYNNPKTSIGTRLKVPCLAQ